MSVSLSPVVQAAAAADPSKPRSNRQALSVRVEGVASQPSSPLSRDHYPPHTSRSDGALQSLNSRLSAFYGEPHSARSLSGGGSAAGDASPAGGGGHSECAEPPVLLD